MPVAPLNACYAKDGAIGCRNGRIIDVARIFTANDIRPDSSFKHNAAKVVLSGFHKDVADGLHCPVRDGIGSDMFAHSVIVRFSGVAGMVAP